MTVYSDDVRYSSYQGMSDQDELLFNIKKLEKPKSYVLTIWGRKIDGDDKVYLCSKEGRNFT